MSSQQFFHLDPRNTPVFPWPMDASKGGRYTICKNCNHIQRWHVTDCRVKNCDCKHYEPTNAMHMPQDFAVASTSLPEFVPPSGMVAVNQYGKIEIVKALDGSPLSPALQGVLAKLKPSARTNKKGFIIEEWTHKETGQQVAITTTGMVYHKISKKLRAWDMTDTEALDATQLLNFKQHLIEDGYEQTKFKPYGPKGEDVRQKGKRCL